MAFTLIITAAGLDALVDAQNGATDPIRVEEVAFSDQNFVAAPTLTALPGEVKRIATISGAAISETVIHMTAQDSSLDAYDVRGFGLFLADGTLFAAYGQENPIVSKASVLNLQLAFDIAFQDSISGDITFGDATFLFPPATETIKGVAEIATQVETDAGTDDERFVTPLKLATRLAAFFAAVGAALDAMTASIAALTGRTITATGLATGGGDLSANRQITVEAASAAELQAATIATKAATPASFGGLPRSRGTVSYEVLPGGTLIQRGLNRVTTSNSQQILNLTFPIAFADLNYDLQLTPVIPNDGDFDNYLQEIAGSRTTTSVQLYSQDPNAGGSSVLAGYNWRAEGVA